MSDPRGVVGAITKETLAYQRVMDRSSLTAAGCIEFHGAPLIKGYGRISDRNKPRRASRVVMEHHFGPSGLMVLHSCDNPPCVNVEHLRYGTHAENMADAVARGRMGHPITIPGRQVRMIREATGSQKSIAAQFGVSQAYVSMVRSGQRRRST